MKNLFHTSLVAAAFTIAMQASAAEERHDNGFQTPSGNIVCFTTHLDNSLATNVQCLVFDNEWNSDGIDNCDADVNFTAVLPTSNSAYEEVYCHSDVWWPSPAPALSYGSTWTMKQEGLECKIEQTGVTCTNKNGNGFKVNRAEATFF